VRCGLGTRDTHDLGPSSVDTSETFKVRSSTGLLVLKGDGVDKSGQGSVDVGINILMVHTTKTSQGVASLCKPVLSNEEEGRLGGKPSDAEDGHRPDPLQSERKTVGQSAGLLRSSASWMFSERRCGTTVLVEVRTHQFQRASNDSRRDEDTPAPAHTDVGGDERTQDSGNDLDLAKKGPENAF
jgi:hypothetical protein